MFCIGLAALIMVIPPPPSAKLQVWTQGYDTGTIAEIENYSNASPITEPLVNKVHCNICTLKATPSKIPGGTASSYDNLKSAANCISWSLELPQKQRQFSGLINLS
ncbi:unnamed protein product [Sphagnum jensenii]|uniref:Uncharacterized protein n=1 Tax=Sphagnum jensenii TaxID=128206 RepID=A0ABP1AVB2_9BRYO